MLSKRCDRAAPRRGVILMVVLLLLTLMAVIGLSFVLYSDAAANSARIAREAENDSRPDVDPELALSFFLGQLIYDVPDDATGVGSALRGHSLLRSMYGYDDTPVAANNNLPVNNVPFNGTGRLHYIYPSGPFQNIDEYFLVNYTYFKVDGFVHDPEHLGQNGAMRADPTQQRAPYTGGFNAPYTYPDLNNFYLAAVDANGTVLTPSFHRKWLFNRSHALNDPSNPYWTNLPGKYYTLRPRPKEHPNFPMPDDATGDVKNLVGTPGGNDSIWIDIGAPIMTAPDGRKYKMLVAPLIKDMDGLVNVNAHGNIRGNDPGNSLVHRSNEGWGPWEVNLSRVLNVEATAKPPQTPQEWKNLFLSYPPPAPLPNSGTPTIYGKYGPNYKPSGGGPAPAGRAAHFYSQTDVDAANEQSPAPNTYGITGPIQYPAPAVPPALPAALWPTFPQGYGNGSAAELANHPMVYDFFRSPFFDPNNDDRVFPASDLEQLLRFQDTGNPALTSNLLRLCPQNFAVPRTRRLVTTHSFDPVRPGVSAWSYNPSDPNAAYQVLPSAADQAPVGAALLFPDLSLRAAPNQPNQPPLSTTSNTDFLSNWWSTAGPRIDLNQPLPPYPHQGSGSAPPWGPPMVTVYDRFDSPTTPIPQQPAVWQQFMLAQTARQKMADAIYRQLLVLTGVAPVAPANQAAPTPADLAPRRWLAQLAVNIVDYIDEDDISTPFNFYTAQDAGVATFNVGTLGQSGTPLAADPELPQYWVFGVEQPHVVVNEALAEYPDATLPPPPTLIGTPTLNVKVWVELYNTMVAGAAAPLQTADSQPIPLWMSNPPAGGSQKGAAANGPYGAYNLVLTTRIEDRTSLGLNDNVLGKPALPPTPRPLMVETFNPTPPAGSPPTMGGTPTTPQPAPSPSIAPTGFPNQGPYFLIVPQDPTNPIAPLPPYRDPTTSIPPAVLAQTPIMKSTNVQYPLATAAPTQPDERTTGVAVILRRLANPHLPPDPNPSIQNPNTPGSFIPNPWYNPYVTVDYLDQVPLRDKRYLGPPVGPYQSRGKMQPYGALTKLAPVSQTTAKTAVTAGAGQTVTPASMTNIYPGTRLVVDTGANQEQVFVTATTATSFTANFTMNHAAGCAIQLLSVYGNPNIAPDSPVADEIGGGGNPPVSHTFGQQNNPAPPKYDWMVHLDRQVISPLELLHVAGCQPWQLTQRFISSSVAAGPTAGTVAFGHYAPWFDQGRRLYRLFEFLAADRRTTTTLNVATSAKAIPAGANQTVTPAVPITTVVNPVSAGAQTVTPVSMSGTNVQSATTTPNAVAAGPNQTVTPASMTGILPGTWLVVDTGANQEQVVVTATTATTFTANFTRNHAGPPGSTIPIQVLSVYSIWSIQPGMLLLMDTGANQEQVVVKTTTATTFTTTAAFTMNHAAGCPIAVLTQSGNGTFLSWNIQPGSRLLVDTGGNQETVVVTTVAAGPPATFTANFTMNHQPGCPIAQLAPVAGKINLNTIWDFETFQALCDAQGSNGFTDAQVKQLFNALMASRTPEGIPTDLDQPFLGLGTGPTVAVMAGNGVANPTTPPTPQTVSLPGQYLAGFTGPYYWNIQPGSLLLVDSGANQEEVSVIQVSGSPLSFTAIFTKSHPPGFKISPTGIENTWLRSFPGSPPPGSPPQGSPPWPGSVSVPAGSPPAGARLLEVQPTAPATSLHPFQKYELLTKIANNVTTRSNVFAVWVTVGLFEVTDPTTTPPTLGAEIGRAEGRQIRHRMFAIINRAAADCNPGPQPRFNPRANPALVPYFSIIE